MSAKSRMPVPEVWIQKPGEEGGCAARPRVMALAEAAWSALAKSATLVSGLSCVKGIDRIVELTTDDIRLLRFGLDQVGAVQVAID